MGVASAPASSFPLKKAATGRFHFKPPPSAHRLHISGSEPLSLKQGAGNKGAGEGEAQAETSQVSEDKQSSRQRMVSCPLFNDSSRGAIPSPSNHRAATSPTRAATSSPRAASPDTPDAFRPIHPANHLAGTPFSSQGAAESLHQALNAPDTIHEGQPALPLPPPSLDQHAAAASTAPSPLDLHLPPAPYSPHPRHVPQQQHHQQHPFISSCPACMHVSCPHCGACHGKLHGGPLHQQLQQQQPHELQPHAAGNPLLTAHARLHDPSHQSQQVGEYAPAGEHAAYQQVWRSEKWEHHLLLRAGLQMHPRTCLFPSSHCPFECRRVLCSAASCLLGGREEEEQGTAHPGLHRWEGRQWQWEQPQ